MFQLEFEITFMACLYTEFQAGVSVFCCHETNIPLNDHVGLCLTEGDVRSVIRFKELSGLATG
jgi:hypothetical protein